MALIIEDGSIVANASSFATVEECRTFAEARALPLPESDSDVEILLVKAMDFLIQLENRFQSERKDPSQSLPFPRLSLYLFGEVLYSAIPKILKDAQCRLAYDASLADLQATGSGRVVKSKSVGPLSTVYEDSASNPQVMPTAAMSLLKPLFKNSAGLNSVQRA